MTTKTQKKNNKQDWEVKKLGEVCNLIKGKKPKTFSKIGKPYLTAKSIRGSEKSKFTEEIEKVVIVSPEDIVIIMDGSNSGEMFQNLNGILASTMGVLNFDKEKIDTRFLLYFLIGYSEEFTKSRTGSAIPHLNKEQFNNLLFPVVSLSEQKRIVKILDGVFADIEEARENAQKNLDNAKELFESYLQDIFENDSGEWEEKKLGKVASLMYGYTEKAKTVGDLRFIRITDTDNVGLLKQSGQMYVDTFPDFEKYLLSDGDLLMARTGASAGNVMLYSDFEKSVFASYLIKLIFEENILTKLYWYFSKSKVYWEQVNELSAGSAQPQFNGGALKQIKFNFPKSLKTQKEIVKKINEFSEQVKEYEAILQNKITDLDELKKSVLQKAFDGEL